MLFCVKHGAFIRTQTDGALVPETAFWSVVETIAGNQQKWPKIAINGLNLGGVSEVVKACGMLNLIGSPVWTRFELLRLKARSSRTTSIAFRSMTSIPNRSTHPDWVPSRDESRTRLEPATSNRQSADRNRNGQPCGVRRDPWLASRGNLS